MSMLIAAFDPFQGMEVWREPTVGTTPQTKDQRW